MRITEEQYKGIAEIFSKQQRIAVISNLEILNAVIYVLEKGCEWRSLPKEYGNWNTIYVRLRRWSKKRVLQKALKLLQEKVDHRIISTNSLSGFREHQGASGWDRRFKRHGKQAIGKSRGGRNSNLHMVAASTGRL